MLLATTVTVMAMPGSEGNRDGPAGSDFISILLAGEGDNDVPAIDPVSFALAILSAINGELSKARSYHLLYRSLFIKLGVRHKITRGPARVEDLIGWPFYPLLSIPQDL